MNIRLALVGLACPFEVGFDDADRLRNETALALRRAGAECLDTGVVMHDLETVEQAAKALRAEEADALLISIATWSEDHHLLDLLSRVDLPVILRAYPAFDTGSLCCAHQIGAVFTDIGKPYEFVYGEPEDDLSARETVRIAASYALIRRMGRVKMGAVGGRVKGMTEIAYDEFAIKKKLGARIVNIDEKEMTEKVLAVTDGEADALLREKADMLRCCRVLSSPESMRESMKYYAALRALVREYDLEALSVKCYTTYMGKVCLAYAILAEEGVVASCEGDVTNALTMKMLYELTGKPVNNTDLLYLDNARNTILFAHCGSSGFSIAGGEIELAPVRLAESGVCARFVAMPGTVTLANLCGHGENLRLSVMTGEAVPCGMEFPGNPCVVRFERDVNDINRWIMQNGIGHHWMIGYGDVREELRRFARLQKIRFFEL